MGGLYRSSEYVSDNCNYITIGKHIIDFDLYTEFMAYYLSEGSVTSTRKNQFSIAQSKEKHPDNYAKIEKLLSKLPFKYTPLKDKFYLNDADMYSYLKQFGKSANKFVPYEIKTSSPSQISIFLNTYVNCDGHSRKCKSFIGSRGNRFSSEKQERVFFSSSDQMASDIGEMLVKIGHRPSYDLQKTKGIAQTHRNGVYVGNKDLWRIRECYSQTSTEFNKEYIDYSGYVYDIELEKNHILYVRRNGKCVWGSNCRCHANPILMDPDEFDTDELNELKAAINGDEYKKFTSRNEVTDVPQGFKDWVANNAERSKGWASKPLFIRDNFNGAKLEGGLKFGKREMLKSVRTDKINISNLVYPKKEAIFDSSIKIKNPAATENSGNVKMNYSEKQIENAKKAYNDFLKYRSVESFEPQYIGYAAAEQRAAYHNKLVKDILSGNKDLEKEWKLFFLKQEVKADQKALEIKSKLAGNKAATQSVLDLVKSNGFKLADYYAFLKKNKKYAKEFYSKKFSAESAKEFMKQ